MVDSKHECLLSSTNTSMVVLKLPEREFKALLTELCTREKKACLQDYIYSVQLKKKKKQVLFKLLKTQLRILPS